MKKDTANFITIVICIVGIIGLIPTMFIVYKNIGGDWTIKFVLGYVIYLLLAGLYFLIITIINLWQMRWIELRKLLLKFIVSIAVFFVINYFLHHGFRLVKINFFKLMPASFGLSIIWLISDFIYFKKRKKYQ